VLYADTSIIVKLYIKEKHSLEVANWLRKNNEAIPLTRFHELEFTNAIFLKQFRMEITDNQIRLTLAKFSEHKTRGVYYYPQISWTDTLNLAIDLAHNNTAKTGSRSLDIIHVASALALKANRFLTLDDRQSELASMVGLKVVNAINPH
jgi:predicted nucleic acid-binding protein